MGLFDFLFGGKKKLPEQPSDDKEFLEKVEVEPGLFVPKAFAAHWSKIADTALPTIKITATPNTTFTLRQSKFGHYPMLPAGYNYPTDAEGKFMYPLAQINFSEVPPLPGFPTAGYLQFYISAYNDVYGLDFDNPQKQEGFKVLFFEEDAVKESINDFSFLNEVLALAEVPVFKPHSLQFAVKNDYIGLGDVRYEKNSNFNLDQITSLYPSIDSKLDDEAYEIFQSNGHKLGGYAYFTQSDPREYNEKFKDYILLFQLDSDDEIMWGDVGVANFFIHPEDLAKKDFSRVLYNWDCC